jgi:hypothetical protein
LDGGMSKEADETQLSLTGLSIAALEGVINDGAVPSVLDYLYAKELSKADSLYLKDKARSFATTGSSAVLGDWSMRGMINALMGRQGMYQGQALGDLSYIQGGSNPEAVEARSQYISDTNARLGIKDAPKLVDILLGYTTPEAEGMREIDARPKGYPFKGDKVYDAGDYVALFNVMSDNEHELRADILELNEGDSINLTNRAGVELNLRSSIDLGRFNYSVGRDDSGYYIAIADVFDTSGSTSAGELLEFAGAHPINLYGRWYFNANEIKDIVVYNDTK